jgi:hypothetical protein
MTNVNQMYGTVLHLSHVVAHMYVMAQHLINNGIQLYLISERSRVGREPPGTPVYQARSSPLT